MGAASPGRATAAGTEVRREHGRPAGARGTSRTTATRTTTAPSSAPMGVKVAWRSTRSGALEVHVARTDGTGEIVNVPQDPGGSNESPSLSADGGTVAWQSIPMWDYEVRRETDGTGLVNVSSDGAFDGAIRPCSCVTSRGRCAPALLHVVDRPSAAGGSGGVCGGLSGRWRRQGGSLARRLRPWAALTTPPPRGYYAY